MNNHQFAGNINQLNARTSPNNVMNNDQPLQQIDNSHYFFQQSSQQNNVMMTLPLLQNVNIQAGIPNELNQYYSIANNEFIRGQQQQQQQERIPIRQQQSTVQNVQAFPPSNTQQVIQNNTVGDSAILQNRLIQLERELEISDKEFKAMKDRFEQQSNLFNNYIIQQLEFIKTKQHMLLYVQQQQQQAVRVQQPDYNVYAHNQQIMGQQQPFYNMSNSLSYTPKNQSQYLQGYQQQYPN
jgi:hypothetical protein